MWLLQWILKAAIFFTLFAFALNNQEDATVHFFFGTQWRAPLVLVVLAAFALGVAVGVLGMVPRWWRQRRVARQAQPLAQTGAKAVPDPSANPPPSAVEPPHGV
jgi:putative membrane protein